MTAKISSFQAGEQEKFNHFEKHARRELLALCLSLERERDDGAYLSPNTAAVGAPGEAGTPGDALMTARRGSPRTRQDLSARGSGGSGSALGLHGDINISPVDRPPHPHSRYSCTLHTTSATAAAAAARYKKRSWAARLYSAVVLFLLSLSFSAAVSASACSELVSDRCSKANGTLSLADCITPTAVTASRGVTQQSAWVKWTEPGGLPGVTYCNFSIVSLPATLTQVVSMGTNNVTMTGLTTGQEYSFMVTVLLGNGSSYSSAVSNSVVAVSVPSAPRNVRATANADGRSITVAFEEPEQTGGLPINMYTATADSDNWHRSSIYSGSSIDLQITMTGFTNGLSYAFGVVALNDVGSSPASSMSNAVQLPVQQRRPVILAAQSSCPANLYNVSDGDARSSFNVSRAWQWGPNGDSGMTSIVFPPSYDNVSSLYVSSGLLIDTGFGVNKLTVVSNLSSGDVSAQWARVGQGYKRAAAILDSATVRIPYTLQHCNGSLEHKSILLLLGGNNGFYMAD